MSAADPHAFRVIDVDALDGGGDTAMADVAERLQELLHRQAAFNRDPEQVFAQQLAMARSGTLSMPGLFDAAATDRSIESIQHERRVYFRFRTAEPYFWVTSSEWYQFAFSGIYFPERKTVVSLPRHGPPPEQLARFHASYVDAAFEPREGTAIVCPGSQAMHMLWNILPALERFAATDLRLPIAYTAEPFGPLEQIIPELEGRVTRLRHADFHAWNLTHRFQVPLGSKRIPKTVRERVLHATRQLRSEALLAGQLAFRSRFRRIVWLCVKPDKRAAVNQVDFLAATIEAMDAPSVGFLLNGVSYPWDFNPPAANASMGRELVALATEAQRLIDAVIERLPPALRDRVACVNALGLPDEIGWSGLADFYVCHAGSMHNKIAWIHNIPGIVHSNTVFLARDVMPMENAARVVLLPDDLIEDIVVEPSARRNGNSDYRIVSPERAAAFCRSTMDQLLGA